MKNKSNINVCTTSFSKREHIPLDCIHRYITINDNSFDLTRNINGFYYFGIRLIKLYEE
jgi:hypothetical protein